MLRFSVRHTAALIVIIIICGEIPVVHTWQMLNRLNHSNITAQLTDRVSFASSQYSTYMECVHHYPTAAPFIRRQHCSVHPVHRGIFTRRVILFFVGSTFDSCICVCAQSLDDLTSHKHPKYHSLLNMKRKDITKSNIEKHIAADDW